MRYLKVFALILFFFFAMLFFVQNIAQLGSEVQLRLQLFTMEWYSRQMPIYLLILLAFVFGALFMMLFFLADKMRISAALRRCKARIAGLEKELNSLRNLPLGDERYAVPEPLGETQNTVS